MSRETQSDASASVPGISSVARTRISPWRLGGLSLFELGKRVWLTMDEDDLFGKSAQLAYYFFIALFPALIFLTSLLGLLAVPGTRLHQSLLHYMAAALPGPAFQLIQQTLQDASKSSGGGKLTFGIIGTLWPVTSGMVAVQDTLNAVYEVAERRPFWKARLIALGLTVVGVVLVIVTLSVILGGDVLTQLVGRRAGLAPIAIWTWRLAEWVIALFFLSMVFSITYYYGPDNKLPWKWLTPGAVVGMTTWIAASIALRLYLHYFHRYTATYGSLGAVIGLLTWFYVTGLMLLLGAEVNVEIDKAVARQTATAATTGPQ